MVKIILLLSCVFTTFCSGVDRSAALAFEESVRKAFGVLAPFPEEIRKRCTGPVQQKITVAEDDTISITISFRCKPLIEEGKTAKDQLVTSKKTFSLSDFRTSTTKRYEINRHLNTMAFFDHGIPWMIAFRSTADVDRALRLFENLVATAKDKKKSSCGPSELARKAGFRSVVCAPRATTLDEAVRLLRAPEQSSHLVCWLTKEDCAASKELLGESFNAFPLFFFDLDLLEKESFYTVSATGSAPFCLYTLPGEAIQSVFSDDKEELERFFHESPYCGIRFEALPSCAVPTDVLSRDNEKRIQEKCKARGMTVDTTAFFQEKPLFLDPEIPQGTYFYWVTGLNDNSDDMLRYVFLQKGLTRLSLRKILYREFPALSALLKTNSLYRKDLSLEDCIAIKMRALGVMEKVLTPFSKQVLSVGCFTNEIGASFGPEEECLYNSWPLALSIAEKLGLKAQEKEALRLLLLDQPMLENKQGRKKEAPLSTLLREAKSATDLHMSIGDWLSLKMCFYLVLAKQFRTVPYGITNSIKRLKEISEQYSLLCSFGLPFGSSGIEAIYPTSPLLSTYIWEVRDPKHRDGLSLKRRRDKFEKMMIEKPKSPWKGRFFDWVDRESEKDKMYPGVFLANEPERAPYLAIFENGILVSPKTSPDHEEELFFVVDSRGRLFVASKKEAKSAEEPGFTPASFFAGGPVASAGKLIVRGGRVVGLTGHSHYYQSGPQELKIALEVLQKAGVHL